jgi:hypothetical protein
MKKKIFAFLAAISVLIMLLGIVAYGATEPTITVESVSVESGKTATVKVFVENNPGMWGMDLRINYDKTKLTLTKVENGEVYSKDEWTEGNLKSEQYILSYARNDFQDTKNNGLLATLTFDIINPDVAGTYDVTATYRAGDVINVNFGEIVFKINNGKVAVKETVTQTDNTESTPDATPEISGAPQLNTFETTISTDAPADATAQPTEEAITDIVEATPVVDDEVENAPDSTVFLIVLVGALVIFTAFYILIKKKKD